MSVEHDGSIVVPSSPVDRQKLKAMITEMTHAMQRISDERGALKDIIDATAAEFNIPKKHIRKLAKTYFERNFDNLQAEHSDFETLYETILESSTKQEG